MSKSIDLSKLENCGALLVANEFVFALTTCGEFLEEHPNHPSGVLFLALTAYLMGDTERAVMLLENLHKEVPDNQEVADALAVILARSGNLAMATYYAKLATVLKPDPDLHLLVPSFFRDFASALTASSDANKHLSATSAYIKGNYAECIKLCRNDLQASPNSWSIYNLLGNALVMLNKYEEALYTYQTALAGKQKTDHETLLQIAFCHKKLFQMQDALLAYQIASQACTGTEYEASILSQIIEDISDLDCDTSSFKETLLERLHNIVLDDVEEAILMSGGEDVASRRIRIAYLSDSLYDCQKGHFIERALNRHDKSKFEIYCYQQNAQTDTTTSRLKVLANDWRVIGDLDDLTAAYLITCDGIDILIDCIGISRNQRLNVIAQKPAPVILSWLNTVNASSLTAVDKALNPSTLTNGGLSFDADADLLRMDHSVRANRSDNSALVFTTLCELNKLTHETILSWSAILNKVPNSNLLIGGVGCDEKEIRERYTSLFMNFGQAHRIFFQNSNQSDTILGDLMEKSDIHLCAFGDTNVNNAATILATGTPLLALQRDDKNVSSMAKGSDLLRLCGKSEWLASTSEEYIDIAYRLASNYKKIDKSLLHSEIVKTAPFQPETLSNDLENAYVAVLKEKGLL
jgi:predicted O-linked N-acetylglucosamine transferase (SPINDLY family)